MTENSKVRVCEASDNPNLWTSDSLIDQLKAGEQCLDCPFMVQCAQDGAMEPYGVWGGLTEWDRPLAQKAEAKRLKEAAALDRRELEDTINGMTLDGMSRKQIAAALRIGESTVSRCREAFTKRARVAAAAAA